MDKKGAVSFVMSLNPGKYRLGLERMSAFLSKINNPENSFQSIIIAGTNGKGSTASYIASILQEAGHKVGKYTSPFLKDFNERIAVNGKKITGKELIAVIEETKNEMKKHKIAPSFFEFVTVLAFKHFAKNKIDIAVLEVGMGGRLDATNTVKNVLGCAITNIALEHTQWLGKTRAKIAKEKAGIIKQNSVLCTTEQARKIRRIFEKECRRKNSKFYYLPRDFSFKGKHFDLKKQVFDFSWQNRKIKNIEIRLLGTHQLYNASLAVAVLLSLKNSIAITEKQIKKGLKKTKWNGRFEIVRKKPLTVFDACHNSAGVKSFRQTFQQIFPGKKAIIVFGCSADKDAKKMLAELKPIAEELIICRAKWRGMETKKVFTAARKLGYKKITLIDDVKSSVKKAVQQKKKIVCVLGSIFLLSDAQAFKK